MAHIKMIHVPYKGSGAVLHDLMGRHVNISFDGLAAAMPAVQSGQLRLLGVTSAKPSPAAPDIPTVTQAGLPGLHPGLVCWLLPERQNRSSTFCMTKWSKSPTSQTSKKRSLSTVPRLSGIRRRSFKTRLRPTWLNGQWLSRLMALSPSDKDQWITAAAAGQRH